MTEPLLHLDADVSIKALQKALLELGHDVSRTPNDWMALDASDEMQLLGATAHGRCILTFNIRDFVPLAQRFPNHGGVILAAQRKWTLHGLITSLDRMFGETDSADWIGQVRWLNQWR